MLYEDMICYHIDKKYTLIPDDNANMVTEAFGIDGGYERKICNIKVPKDFGILYIVGESGSGKSTIARELMPNYREETIPYNIPLFLWGGNKQDEQIATLNLLSMVGISDATMFISKYSELSDSQQARARVYLELRSEKQTILIDEFLSTLDRKTASAIAYSTQKAIRRANKKAILVTAHDDLKDYLMPDWIIEGKSFPSSFRLTRYNKPKQNVILEKIELHYGDSREYKELTLGELHYKGKYTGGAKEYLFANLDGENIGVLVSVYRMHDGGRRIARLVVHPSYRNIGVGRMLVKKYIDDFPDADVISAMGRFNRVFELSGMVKCSDVVITPPSGLQEKLKDNGFNVERWHSRKYCTEISANANIRKTVSLYSSHATKMVQPGGKHLSVEEVESRILDDEICCGRVLYGFRTRTMAKYVTMAQKRIKRDGHYQERIIV